MLDAENGFEIETLYLLLYMSIYIFHFMLFITCYCSIAILVVIHLLNLLNHDVKLFVVILLRGGALLQ